MNDAMTLLRRDFLIPELEDVMREAGVEGTVAVQARQTITETEWLLDIAEHHPFILGVVGWAPLAAPDAGLILDRLVQHSRLKALRHVLHDEPDDFYMLNDDFNRGIDLLESYRLAYDILIFERHLPQTIVFVDRHPGQVFIIDHIAKPRIRDGVVSPWREHMEDLAKRENVYCKVSGMTTEANWNMWSPDMLRPYFDVVLSTFGPKRLMFGSDWPVLTLAGTYKTWMDTFRSFVRELSVDEQECLRRSTAIAAYQL
jgi:L-fuconolactonase